MTILKFGWNEIRSRQFEPYAKQGLIPARVTAVFSWQYEIISSLGKGSGEMTGKLRYDALYAAKRPAVGDWVAARPINDSHCLIHAVLPRTSCLQRQKVDGDVEAQVVASNVDVCFIVQALQGDFNLPRLDRYIAFAASAQVAPVIVLTKADLVDEAEELRAQVRMTHPDIPVFMVSAVTGTGIEEVQEQLEPYKTYAAVGSSGVGKSTLLNVLSGTELMKTAQVREDDMRGRHTTTHRQMFCLPNGSLYIDTPGIRELALFEHDGLGGSFRDVEGLARQCKFRDCQHMNEPGCAVQRAIKAGELDEKRLASFAKMKREEGACQSKQILLTKKVSKAKIKRSTVHYKDYVRGGGKKSWKLE
ncbi:MAG TPA: ribosome small subunit-dependent GTPase A [Firmicutes bacterium]|nr:ribosome small subunit-dependent GTPase A [Bacillota bacterium]